LILATPLAAFEWWGFDVSFHAAENYCAAAEHAIAPNLKQGIVEMYL